MTAGQGLALVIGVWILVVMIIAMLVAMVAILMRTAKTVTSTTHAIQEKVDGVVDRANGVMDQGQQAISLVTGRIDMLGKVVAGVGGALTGVRVMKQAKTVARGSTDMASAVLSGIKAGFDRLVHSDEDRKGEHHQDG